MLRFEACASFDLLHSEALHLRRPAVLCGQPKNCGQARQPPPPPHPSAVPLAPSVSWFPHCHYICSCLRRVHHPLACAMRSGCKARCPRVEINWGHLALQNCPVNLTIQNTGASSPPPPPFFFMARALFPARPPPASSLHQQALPTPPMCFKFMLCGAMQAAQARAT